MKKISVLIVGFLFLMVGVCSAADVALKWDASDGATGYKIYKSLDLRATWDAGVDVGSITTYVYTGIREDGPVDFRVSAYNATGESVRYWSGAWYDKTFMPPDDPGGTGIE